MKRIKVPVKSRRKSLLVAASYQQVLDKIKEIAEESRKRLLTLQKPESQRDSPGNGNDGGVM